MFDTEFIYHCDIEEAEKLAKSGAIITKRKKISATLSTNIVKKGNLEASQ